MGNRIVGFEVLIDDERFTVKESFGGIGGAPEWSIALVDEEGHVLRVLGSIEETPSGYVLSNLDAHGDTRATADQIARVAGAVGLKMRPREKSAASK